MHIEKKEKYTLISSDENSFSDFYTGFLNTLPQLEKEHIVIKISDKINVKKEEFFLFLTTAVNKKENDRSFVIINSMINADDFPENLTIVPTLIEAEDILEMEAMERELGF
ncbi:hypothetical protein [Polaribacter sp. R77954]|uniref:hypothetical protein n=1 Tax=Polaribacter sp. R77954 TaxID=3093870 RepID=UPI0037CCBB6A